MDNGFDLLEEKVRKTADLVKRLRNDNKSLAEELGKARARLNDAEQKLEVLERGARNTEGGEAEALRAEVRTLRQEREDVRARIARLVEALEGLD